MSDRPVQLLPNPKPPEKTPYRPVLITIACAVGTAAGSCAGFLATDGSPGWASIGIAFALVFSLSCLAFLLSLVWLLFVAVSNGIRGRRG